MTSRSNDKDIAICEFFVGIFTGNPDSDDFTVETYEDEAGRERIDILLCQSSIPNSIQASATLNLSDHRLFDAEGKIRDFGVELIGASDHKNELLQKILSTCAFYIINDGWLIEPGIVFPNIVSIHDDSLEMKHVMFVSQFLWENSPSRIVFKKYIIVHLLAVLISDEEYNYAIENNSEKLIDFLLENDVEMTNPNRKSAI